MRLVPRLLSALLLIALVRIPPAAHAACSGECGADLAAAPKAVEKYVKAAWKALGRCGKSAKTTCPVPCAVPDGAAEPYGLGASCAGRVACELAALAATTWGATWDDLGGCALGAGTACGNVRAAAAGRLVGAKLVRRRTSTMHRFAKDAAQCATKIAKVPACGADPCDGAADWIDAIFPLAISPTGFQHLPFAVAAPGEGVATLLLATTGTDWGAAGRESVVVRYDLDGVPLGHLVLYGGETPTAYRVLLGPLAAGPHVLALHPEKSLSPAAKAPVTVLAAASVEAIAPPDARYELTRFAPLLLGIDPEVNVVPAPTGPHRGNARSDVPLVVYATAVPGVGLTTWRYVLIWSNEDGGTGLFPDLLIARYGRTTDIEGIVEVDVSDAGERLAVRFRPDESGTLAPFAGAFRGEHPIVRTATANGLVQDDGASAFTFGLAPFAFDDAGVPRELGMDLDPIAYAVMAKEMVREGKIEPLANPSTKKLSDLRNYLYVDYDVDVDVGGQVLRGVAVVNGIPWYSDHALAFTPALNPRVSAGVGRLAIELPPGTTIADVAQFGLQGIGTMSGTLASARAFMLDADYLPGTARTAPGPQFQSGVNPVWMVTP